MSASAEHLKQVGDVSYDRCESWTLVYRIDATSPGLLPRMLHIPAACCPLSRRIL